MDHCTLHDTQPCSLVDLARRAADADGFVQPALAYYSIVDLPCSELVMSDVGWAESFATFKVPHHELAAQSVVAVTDRLLHRGVLVNPLRGRRMSVRTFPAGPSARAACRWCDPKRSFAAGILSETFGVTASRSRRALAGPNHARSAPLSGLVFGDETMHDLLELTTDDACELFEAAAAYIAAASRVHAAPFWLIIQNGGYRSASTVEHAHLQVVGRADRHFGYPATVAALTRPGYWQEIAEVHGRLGLAVDLGHDGGAFANVAPVKERDVTALTSGSLADGARTMWSLVRALIAEGTESWSLAAMVNPRLVGYSIDPYRDWPDVVWRFVDRGHISSPAADIGAMELFGSSVVAEDPYLVADLLRSAKSGSIRSGG